MAASEPMARALAAAAAVRGTTSPNPWVGAVVVRDGAVIATGATAPPGGRHAEAAALNGIDARGADVYVTLEPCSAFPGKRTPPCSEALIAAGVRRVVVALEDPDPGVSGRGIAAMRAAGIDVTVGDGADEARALLRPYLRHRRSGRPYVIAKWAASLDGRVAAPAAGVRWLTGELARERVHADRAWVDAILVGVGTALQDAPALTARPGGRPAARQPARIVLDTHGRLPVEARMLNEPGTTIVAHGPAAPRAWREVLAARGAQTIECEAGDDGVSLEQLLPVLARRGVVSLIVEGGPRTHASFFAGEWVDEVHAYQAPLVIGPERGAAVSGGPGFPPVRLSGVAVEELGPDLLVRGYTSEL